jgi:hypothetical protein
MFRKQGTFFACLLALGGAVATAHADDVVVPNAFAAQEGGTAFHNLTDQHRVMLVYDASQFAAFGGPILITEIAIRPNSAQAEPGTVLERNLRTFLSTTPMSPATLSTTFADNIGPDYTLVAGDAASAFTTAYLPGPGKTIGFDITVPLETPFRYDPAAGNLLLEFQSGPPAPEGSMIFDFVAGDPTLNGVAAVGSSTAESGQVVGMGFVLQFTVVAVP